MRVDNLYFVVTDNSRQPKRASDTERVSHRQEEDSIGKRRGETLLQGRAIPQYYINFMTPLRERVCKINQVSLAATKRAGRADLKYSQATFRASDRRRQPFM
jgi:hypothetical protein